MNTDPENFEELRKLLALKKHEQPPPGYFNELPGKIWTRIERENAAPASFWEGFLSRFVLRPTVAYSFAFVVCATLIVGIGSSLNDGQQAGTGTPMVLQSQPGTMPTTPALAELGDTPHGNESSTNPLVPMPNLQIQVQPVGFNR
ncbi:MAG: hypothetical protein ACK4UN_15915 [Limisphaerales bacterium]